MISFSPLGTSSSGTLYLAINEERMAAVKLFGPTGRIQQWEYDPEVNQWRRIDVH